MSSDHTPGSTFGRVLDDLGSAIVRGELPAGHADTVDHLVEALAASRSIVREATRVLAAAGLLTAGRRIGLRVTPMSRWDTLNANVIRWRLESPDRETQLAELLELRLAIEPAAAGSAAIRRSPEQAEALVAAVGKLQNAALEWDEEVFLSADRQLHGLILDCSNNAMFSRLRSVIDEALSERTPHSVEAWEAAGEDVKLHVALVDAILSGEPTLASELMTRIARGS